MATKVDNTASMLCRRHGCVSEKILERMLEADALLEDALQEIRNAVELAEKGNVTGCLFLLSTYLQAVEKGNHADD